MWSKYTGVLIWKTQNPWTGLRGQFYDHLLDQTAGFYGCRSAAEPVHVQLNLSTYFIEASSIIIQILLVFGLNVETQCLCNILKYNIGICQCLNINFHKTIRIVNHLV